MSGRISTKTGVPPLKQNAFAVETKVKEGMIISSPGLISASNAQISNAAVQEWVRRAFLHLIFSSSHDSHNFVNFPSPASCPDLTAPKIKLISL